METQLTDPTRGAFKAHAKVTPRGWFSRLLWRFIRVDVDNYTLVIEGLHFVGASMSADTRYSLKEPHA